MIDCNNPKCTGCGACTVVCPVGESCISMTINSIGEYEPECKENCVNCGACNSVCNAENEPLYPKMILQAYYGWSRNDTVRLSSTSGGLFQQIAIDYIDKGGNVVGAAYSSDFNEVQHIIVNDMESLSQICRSKYTESVIWRVLPEIKKLLNEGKKVLFSGVPCQITQLNLYLKKKYDNLTTVEIFCHGTPRIGVWKRYISWLNNVVGSLRNIQFRDKTCGGWETPVYYIEGNKKTLKQYHDKNVYHMMFGYHESLRRSCFQCKYRTKTRYADLSVGDFWGIKKYYPNVDTSKGVSAILVNSDKGKLLLENDSLDLFDCKEDEIFDLNKWMIMNFETPDTVAVFNKRYSSINNDKAFFIVAYFMYKTVYRVRNLITRILKK